MSISKKLFFVLIAVAVVAIGLIFYEPIVEKKLKADYEKKYPKFVDSKEPLAALQLKDVQCVKKAIQDLKRQPIPSPTIMPYGILPIQQLDIYRLSGNVHNPVIFFIDAGPGDKRNVRYAVPAWLSLGYTVVSINHRSMSDNNSFSEMIEDCNISLKWVIDHIYDYGGDPARIAVTGTSCGGHLAAMLVTDTKSQQKYGIDISRVKCWFPMSGFYDMDLKENLISPVIKKYIEWICVPSKTAASPAALATGKEPPCLIIHGGDDWVVPKTNAVSLYNRLDKKKTTLAIVKGYMHAHIFYSYLNPDHEPAKLIKKFLATHLPAKHNPEPEKGSKN